MNNFITLIPLIVFIISMMGIGFYVNRKRQLDHGFSKDYYIGGRSLGGFTLAMTLIATYGSVSSFVGGPGMAWKVGFGWVYYSSIQIACAYLVLGVFGKKLALIARKIDAVTIPDLIRHRYNSNFLATVSAIIIVIFFITTMVAQFIGGAKLFEAATGYSYIIGLIIFGIATIIYTSVGGFKAVAITDTCCAVIMIIGTLILAAGVLNYGGGLENIMSLIETNYPTHLQPLSHESLNIPLFIGGWFLVGFCLLGLPQSVVRCFSYKDTKSVHRAMIYGTFCLGIMVIGMHIIGVLSTAVITDTSIADVDSIMPMTIMKTLPKFLAGIAICGPLSASMSTVSSLLIAASSSIVKDIYLHKKESEKAYIDYSKVSIFSTIVTFLIGIIVFVIAIKPPSVIVWINLFAFGGLEAAFFWVFYFGIFWKNANEFGAKLSMIGGTVLYLVFGALKINILGLHNIVWAIIFGLVLFVVGSKFGEKPSREIMRIYFPEKI